MKTELNTHILEAVSRSFYLSLRFVPKEFRPGVSIMYLLARTTDTIADTAKSSGETLIKILADMDNIIQGHKQSDPVALCAILKTTLAPQQEHIGEKNLLEQFHGVLELFWQLPEEQAIPVMKVLHTIIQGQTLDLKRFDCATQQEDTLTLTPELRALPNEETLLEYTYLVAGCVGEFWTELGYAIYGEQYSQANPEHMRQWGKHYGQALQLINIIRDVQEDAQRGRRYLPPVESPQKERRLLAHYSHKAKEWLAEGMLYTAALNSYRLRFATGLPILIGIDTLNKCATWKGIGKAKITRKEVYGHILTSILYSFSRHGKKWKRRAQEEDPTLGEIS